jgi:hypothetical protein
MGQKGATLQLIVRHFATLILLDFQRSSEDALADWLASLHRVSRIEDVCEWQPRRFIEEELSLMEWPHVILLQCY